jgi:hypothetical protein
MDQRDSAPLDPALAAAVTLPTAVARFGWAGTLQGFVESEPTQVLAALQHFVPDAGLPQVTAWRDSIRLADQG